MANGLPGLWRPGGNGNGGNGADNNGSSGAGARTLAARSNSAVSAGSGSGRSGSGRISSAVGARVSVASDGAKRAAAALGAGATRARGTALTIGRLGAGTAVGGLMASLRAASKTGQGFREFLLKGPVVELAVAVVVGCAATG